MEKIPNTMPAICSYDTQSTGKDISVFNMLCQERGIAWSRSGFYPGTDMNINFPGIQQSTTPLSQSCHGFDWPCKERQLIPKHSIAHVMTHPQSCLYETVSRLARITYPCELACWETMSPTSLYLIPGLQAAMTLCKHCNKQPALPQISDRHCGHQRHRRGPMMLISL